MRPQGEQDFCVESEASQSPRCLAPPEACNPGKVEHLFQFFSGVPAHLSALAVASRAVPFHGVGRKARGVIWRPEWTGGDAGRMGGDAGRQMTTGLRPCASVFNGSG